MFKHFQITIFIIISVLLFCFISGCGRTQEPPKFPPANQDLENNQVPQNTTILFAIMQPKSNDKVDRNIITLKGVGAAPGDVIEVEVFTDRWYLQNGNYQIENDGKWNYTPCYLMGSGGFRFHHNIRAKRIVRGTVIATSTIDDIEAPEPNQ